MSMEVTLPANDTGRVGWMVGLSVIIRKKRVANFTFMLLSSEPDL